MKIKQFMLCLLTLGILLSVVNAGIIPPLMTPTVSAWSPPVLGPFFQGYFFTDLQYFDNQETSYCLKYLRYHSFTVVPGARNEIRIRFFLREINFWCTNHQSIMILLDEKIEFTGFWSERHHWRDVYGNEWEGIESIELLAAFGPHEHEHDGVTYRGNWIVFNVTGKEHETMGIPWVSWDVEIRLTITNPDHGVSPVWVSYADLPNDITISLLQDLLLDVFEDIVLLWWLHVKTAGLTLVAPLVAEIVEKMVSFLGQWYCGQSFMVLSPESISPPPLGPDPSPIFSSTDMLDFVAEGAVFNIDFVVNNTGGMSPEAYLTVSFSDGLSVLDCNGDMRPPGTMISHRDGSSVPAQHAIIDFIETPFEEGNTRDYWATLQARESGSQWIAYRLCFDKPGAGYDWVYNPAEAESSDRDQQGWPVHVNSIDVAPPSSGVLLDVVASAQDEVIVGEEFGLTAYVESEGVETAHDVTAFLQIPLGLELISGEISQVIGDIPPGFEDSCDWVLRAELAGDFTLNIEVYTNEVHGYEDDDTIIVHEVPSLSCEIVTSSKIPISSRLHVIAEVANTAETTIHNLSATLTYSPDLSLISPPDPVQEEEKLIVGETWTPNWLLEPTAPDSNGWVQVDVSSETGPTDHDRRDVEVYAPQWEGRIIRNLTARARSVAVGDVDSDGICDIVIGSSDAHPGNGYIHVFRSTGDLLWSYQPDGYSVMAVGIGDVDGDGYGDVVCGTGKGYAYGIRSNRTGPTTFSPNLLWGRSCVDNPSWWIEDVEVGDFDGDGRMDVASGSSGWGTVCALRGYDGVPFWPCRSHDGEVSVIAVGDVDSDGKDDIAVGIQDSTTPYDGVSAYRGFDGSLLLQFREVETIRGAVAVGDLDGDGGDEVIAGSMNTWTVYALKYSRPPNPTLLWARYLPSADIRCIEVDDLDGDEDNDVAVGTEYVNGDNCVALDGSNGNMIWTIALGDQIPSLDIGDLDGNGLNDVAAGGDDLANDILWIVNSSGSLFWNKTIDGKICKRGLLVDDINADGMSDIIVAIGEGNLYVLTTAVIDDVGPVAGLLSLHPDLCRVSPQLNATLTDAISEITAAEYFIDSIGVDGSGIAMTPYDGRFDSQTEDVVATISISGLTDGLHTVYVHGIDGADNWGGFVNCTFTVDTVPPETEVTDGPNGITDEEGFFIRWTGSDTLTDTPNILYSYILQGYETDWSDWAHLSSKGYYGLAEGNYTFKVKARDETGNIDPTPAKRSFQIGATGLGDSLSRKVVMSDSKQAYFIFADPVRMKRAVAAYDVTSGGMVYGICANDQNQGFDSNPDYVAQYGSEKGRLLMSNKTVLFFGGPSPHWCVSYYENEGLTPVKAVMDNAGFSFLDRENASVATISRAAIESEHEDMFVLEVFQDSNSNIIFTFYGFDWKGTWAAGIYLHDFLIDQLVALTNDYYVYHWVDDSEQDGIPQASEIHLEASG